MKKFLKRLCVVVALLVAVVGGVLYWFFGYGCHSFAPEFHERWSPEARQEWMHLDNLLRRDARAATLLIRETGLAGKDTGVLGIAANISAMLELVEYAAEHGELQADADGDECRVRKACLSHLLVMGGYLHIVEDLYLESPPWVLHSVPAASYMAPSDFCLLAHLINGVELAHVREEVFLTPLPERWALVRKLLSRRDEVPADVVKVLGALSVETKNPEYALYAAQHFEQGSVQKIFLFCAGIMMDNGLPLVKCMIESGCPAEYVYRDGSDKWCLKSGVKHLANGNDVRDKLEYLRAQGYISAEEVDAVLSGRNAQKDGAGK